MNKKNIGILVLSFFVVILSLTIVYATHSFGELYIITSPSSAKIYIDDRFIVLSPSILVLNSGYHDVKLVKVGYDIVKTKVYIQKSIRTKLVVKLNQTLSNTTTTTTSTTTTSSSTTSTTTTTLPQQNQTNGTLGDVKLINQTPSGQNVNANFEINIKNYPNQENSYNHFNIIAYLNDTFRTQTYVTGIYNYEIYPLTKIASIGGLLSNKDYVIDFYIVGSTTKKIFLKRLQFRTIDISVVPPNNQTNSTG